MKLLIVDDHAHARELTRSCLEPLADELYECSSGEAAVYLCDTRTPEVIVIDLRLGSDDGLAVIDRIRSEYPAILIVVLTQFDSPAISALVMRKGAAACFAKSELPNLRTYLAGWSQRRRSA